ncbi:hypothetical protein ACQKEI_12210 [Psychrobacter namhaensis]|uniref:hypothetical protein n=1 Tax=Psychrobacter namhaensis TaxID=292734 RepID=UPI003D02F6EB
MSIIDQLEKSVTPAVLGEGDRQDNVAYVSLLEQFYAILAARLALPQVYSQLLRANQVTSTATATDVPLLEQLWPDQRLQQVIIQELAASFHIDERSTAQLLFNAVPLAYRELTILANGQFLPAFLQGEQARLRPYLPIWSAPVITAAHSVSYASDINSEITGDANTVPVRDPSLNELHESETDKSATAAYLANADVERANTEIHFGESNDAFHANPSAHHQAENISMKHEKVRTRNQRNDLLVRVFLLLVAVVATGLAAWALYFRPNSPPPVEPVEPAPVVVAPAPVAQVVTPVELIVGVDDSGSLYTCSATVGDDSLQSTLQQALSTSFGEQASICELTVQKGVANSLTNLPVEVLPNVLTLLRATPFARLHLQNDRLTLEAPDSLLLQRLATDVRTLAPALTVDSAAPLPLPENNQGEAMNDTADMNGENNQFENERTTSNRQYGSDYNGGESGEYQAPDDDTGDRVRPTPAPSNSGFNSNNNGLSNTPNNVPTNNRPSGPISQSEVDDMASTIIVAEPAQVR